MHSKTSFLPPSLPSLFLPPSNPPTPYPQNKQTKHSLPTNKQTISFFFIHLLFTLFLGEYIPLFFSIFSLPPKNRGIERDHPRGICRRRMLKQRRNTKVSSRYERMPTFQLSHLLHAARRRNLTQALFIPLSLIFLLCACFFVLYLFLFCLFVS